jgi:hypothetical protein
MLLRELATTFTATQTFSGTSSTLAAVLTDAAETTTISATAATGTIAYDVTTQSVLYYTSNASANWTVNFRGSSGTSLNTLMSTGPIYDRSVYGHARFYGLLQQRGAGGRF